MAGISMSRRTIALVVALVLAAIAAIALVSYTTSVKNKAAKDQTLVQVYVAKEDIPAGTSGDTIVTQGLLTRISIPQNAVTTGAIGNLSDIQGKVASVTILANEQVTSARFVAPGSALQGGQLISIPKGLQAISIEVGTVPGVSGFVQVGDKVSILAELSVPAAGGQQAGPRVQFLLQNVSVLQIGRRVVTQVNGQNQASTQNTGDKIDFTLAVTPSQAEKIVFATLNGTLYFTLVTPDATEASTPGRTIRNAFNR